MERLNRRLAEAAAAVAALDELAWKTDRILVERHSAALRLIYSHSGRTRFRLAVWTRTRSRPSSWGRTLPCGSYVS
jgi:hypothetical protein